MKLVLKFSVDQILAISYLLNKVYELPFNSFGEEQKIAISIGVVLADKFETKKRELKKKLSLINRNNKIQLTLKYHEAWALKNICINQISWSESEFEKLNIQSTIHLIDQAK
ncbi:hypothetical protein [Tenacibaculum caenipelagi]|uniref:Uncharacterized protein n=1 Tax=Tenacibaculum caenipelagi TaxID=1325435 RepID=A0A4V3D2S5_9FLAO|nr:hypothetical protein [Tenacibaculum caenipelagi]TDQ22775.1 hypothetical protein DFQ07_2793 [Tenacibaculum caenipelagi]